MLKRFAILLVLVACSTEKSENLDRRVIRAECTAAVEHAAALLEADPASAGFGRELRETAAQAIEQCLATARLRDHRCIMQAKTAQDMGLCPMPGTSGEAK